MDIFTTLTVLPPPSGARITRDVVYSSDATGALKLDIYRPSTNDRAPVVFLVNGDAPEEVISRAKDWGVYRSYGEHLAARGLAAVAFNHRSTNKGRDMAAVARSVRQAIDFVLGRADQFEIDSARVAVWAFSAGGPFSLAPLLQTPPPWLRAVAGFYAIWDLSPFRDDDDPPSDEEIGTWSCTTAIDGRVALPPILVARAGKDGPRILGGTDTFIVRARARGIEIEVHDHPEGHHGFDIRDDDDRSRAIIRAGLAFFETHLGSRSGES